MYNLIRVRDNSEHSKHSKTEENDMARTNYNLSNIMKKAWQLFDADVGTFAECLKKAWADAKAFTDAIRNHFINNTKFPTRENKKLSLTHDTILLECYIMDIFFIVYRLNI